MRESTGHTKALSEGLYTVVESDWEGCQKYEFTENSRRPKSNSQCDYKRLFELTQQHSSNSQIPQPTSDEIPECDYEDDGLQLRPSLYTNKSHKQSTESLLREEKYQEKDLFIPFHEESRVSIAKSEKEQCELESIQMKNGGCYTGQWYKKKPHGTGEYKFPDSSKYIGEWVNGYASGKGTFYDVEGGYYKGDFHQNCMQGVGIYKYADGSFYEGQWIQDKYHGHGIEIKLGNHYKGKFQNGLKHGMGILTFSNQEKYDGHFVNDLFDGKGTFTWPDGRRYEGDWKRSMMHGFGMLQWPDGRVYVGQYQNDKRHGFGTFQFVDGRKYAGQWMCGVQHGSGQFTEAHGQITKGVWRDGKLIALDC